MTPAAAKGEKLFLLAAALLAAAAALLAPASVEASRYLPQAIEPASAPQASLEDLAAGAADHPALPALTASDRLDLVDQAAGARLEAQRLGLHLTLGELEAAQKTASGGQTWALEDNVRLISEMGVKTRRPTFQGLWTDPITGLSYARARWYDARNASWLSEDPLLDVDSPNLYAFVGWGPHAYTDPLGLQEATSGDLNSAVDAFCARAAQCWDVDYDAQAACLNRTLESFDAGEWAARLRHYGLWEESSAAQADSRNYSALDETVRTTRQDLAKLESGFYESAGDLGRGMVEGVIPAVPLDPERQRLANLAGQGGTVAGGNGAVLVNHACQDFGDVGAGLSRAGAVLMVAAVETKAGDVLLTEGAQVVGSILTKEAVSGNSLRSTRAQHGYEIVDTRAGEVVKTGVSGGRRTVVGGSYRANSQANRWNRTAGEPGRYQPTVVKEIPAGKGARENILEWEAENAARLREEGQLTDPTKHVRP